MKRRIGSETAARNRQAPGNKRDVVRARFDKVFEKIYRLVLRIPRGRVMTYGQIARLLEERYSPRLVGWALHAAPSDGRNIPWHRVINSRGGISTGRIILHEPDLQRLLLEAEGVIFDRRGCCDLGIYQWSPRVNRGPAISSSKRTSKTARRRPPDSPTARGRASSTAGTARKVTGKKTRTRV